jgi:hypothetical protein
VIVPALVFILFVFLETLYISGEIGTAVNMLLCMMFRSLIQMMVIVRKVVVASRTIHVGNMSNFVPVQKNLYGFPYVVSSL